MYKIIGRMQTCLARCRSILRSCLGLNKPCVHIQALIFARSLKALIIMALHMSKALFQRKQSYRRGVRCAVYWEVKLGTWSLLTGSGSFRVFFVRSTHKHLGASMISGF